jgi:SHOCT-like domain
MSAERKKILEMLAEGKISAEDAERLLDKISASAPETTPAGAAQPAETGAPPKKLRYLRIQVERPGEDNVNVRVPLAFTRTGSRLLAVLPRRVSDRLSEQGIDLAALSMLNDEDLAKALEELHVDIEKGNGKKVKIFCE